MAAMRFEGLARGLFITGLFALKTNLVDAAEQYLLRYRFTPEQTWTYVSQNDAAITVEYSQGRDEPKHTEMMVRTVAVRSVSPDGMADLDLKIERAIMSATGDGVTTLYDSSKPDKVDHEFAEVHESLRKPTRIRLNSQGKLLPLEGEADPVLDDLFVFLPEQPVEIGTTWKEKFESGVQIDPKNPGLMRPVKMERRFVLKSVESGIATISMSTVCISHVREQFQESQIMQRKPAGILRFDINQGCLENRDLRIDEKVVGFQGAGTAISTRIVKIDRLIAPEQAALVDLSKPMLPVTTAFAEGAAKPR